EAIGQMTFTENKDADSTEETSEQEIETDTEDNNLDEETYDEANENNKIEITEIHSSDPNVIEAYTGDWQAIGTDQEGPHTTVYTDGSQDRIEIKQAVLSITELNEGDLVEHWVGNGGDQKVI